MSQPTAPTTMKRIRRGEHGASIIDLLIMVTIVGIVVTAAFHRINSVQRTMRVANSARELQSYLEKVRVDSVRRHAVSSAQKASVQIVNATTYTVTMDVNGSGTVATRTITLHQGSTFSTGTTALPISISFDWRGRATIVDGNNTAIASSSFTIDNNTGDSGDRKAITVSSSGDAGTNSETVTRPTVQSVSSNANVRSKTTVPSGMTVTQ